jgi:hypothetical protein
VVLARRLKTLDHKWTRVVLAIVFGSARSLSLAQAKEKAQYKTGLFLWCSIVDAFQTAAIDAQEDYKLKYLVEQFQLEGSLI